MDETTGKQHHYQGSMPTYPNNRPPEPGRRKCLGGCGGTITAEFIEPVEIFGRVLDFSNKWIFESEFCEACETKKRKMRAEAMAKIEKMEREKHLIEILTPRGFEEYTFERYKPMLGTERAIEAFKDFDPARSNIYVWGSAGSGKTHLAAATFRTWYKDNGIFVKHATLNRSMQGLKSKEYDEELKKYVNAKLLVVDDLGTAKQTDYASQVLYEILDGRLMQYKSGMIITSNLALDDLSARLGDDRMVSRIAQMCQVVKLSSKDWRIGSKK